MEQAGTPGRVTTADLVRALQDECRADRLKVEDFLNALCDLCIEALKAGKTITLWKLGILAPANSRQNKAIAFRALPHALNSLGLPDKPELGPLCSICKKNKRAPRRSLCATCRTRRFRAGHQKQSQGGKQ